MNAKPSAWPGSASEAVLSGQPKQQLCIDFQDALTKTTTPKFQTAKEPLCYYPILHSDSAIRSNLSSCFKSLVCSSSTSRTRF